MDRQRADWQLFKDVKAKGYPITGFLMYLGVRIGGSVFWPFHWRWAYGRVYFEKKLFRGYD